MANNLATESVTRHVVQQTDAQTVDQYIQVEFGALNASRNLVTINRPEQKGQSIVTSETIGTPQNDYSRYINIQTPQTNAQGKPIDASKIVGIWGKTDSPITGQPVLTQYLQQGVLGIVPFANLSGPQRQSLIKLMQDKGVYDISSEKPKHSQTNNRAVYVYSVAIKPKPYIEMIEAFTKALGLTTPQLDANSYAGSQPLQVQFTVDKLSRQLVKINYKQGGQEESFSAQGLEQPITLPTKTIPIGELQKRVQQSLQ